MLGTIYSLGSIARARRICLGLLWASLLSQTVGCIFGDVSGTLLVRGCVIDMDTLEPLPEVAVGGRTFTGEVEIDFSPALTVFGDRNNRAPDADGTFEVFFATDLGPYREPPEFPRPDQVEIIVVRDGCEQTFPIEINEDTVVDMDFPDDVIELKEPILVPGCEE